MARRFTHEDLNAMHDVLARTAALSGEGTDLAVSLNVHGVPAAEALQWMAEGLIDSFDADIQSNPITGKRKNGVAGGSDVITVFTTTYKKEASV